MDRSSVFGTDGVRGRVGEYPMVAEFLLHLGWSVGSALNQLKLGNKVLIGKDTRLSGYLVESALQAGLASAGADTYLLGPMPTPGIAYLTRALHAQIGIVISASHNPYEDNGVKFFSKQGYKIEKSFEDLIRENLNKKVTTAPPEKLGRAFRVKQAQGRYIEFCKSSVPHITYYNNMKIILDCANGSTYVIAPDVFSELGGDVTCINANPNGININLNCGSLHPETLIKTMSEQAGEVGIAFDGDGDRVLMIDEKGEILDGDDLLYIIVKEGLSSKRLTGGVVGTQMSNQGLALALHDLGIAFVRTKVGDQYILRELIQKQWTLGGEPSGHIINRLVNSTGDGIITALQVLQAKITSGKTLHELKQGLNKFPQKIINIPTNGSRVDLDTNKIQKEVEKGYALLGKYARIIIRPSGTEPIIRLMIEAEDDSKLAEVSDQIKEVIEDAVAN